jgi:hypothetical protein
MSAGERREEGYDLPPFSTVHEEIAVGREYLTRIGEFGHANQARIRDAHRLVRVFPEETGDIGSMRVEHEIEPDDSALHETQNRLDASPFRLQHERGSRKDGLARPQRMVEGAPALHGPRMMPVVSVQVRDQWYY